MLGEHLGGQSGETDMKAKERQLRRASYAKAKGSERPLVPLSPSQVGVTERPEPFRGL